MDAIREIFDSIRKHLRDRLANPLYAAYAFAWAVLNFRLVLVLVGDGDWKSKIDYIDGTLYKPQGEWLWRGFLYPAAIAAIYVLAAPFLQRWVSVFLREREKVTAEKLLKIAGETPLSPEAADELRSRLLKERAGRLEERRGFEAQIAEQSAQIDLLNSRLKQAATNPFAEAGKQPPVVDKSSAPEHDRIEEPEEEEEEGAPSRPGPSTVLKVLESDLVGVAQTTKLRIANAGITRDQARALYAARNGQRFRANDIAKAVGISEPYAAQVLIDKLKGLGLIVSMESNTYEITSAGRQALDAVISRGFDPEIT